MILKKTKTCFCPGKYGYALGHLHVWPKAAVDGMYQMTCLERQTVPFCSHRKHDNIYISKDIIDIYFNPNPNMVSVLIGKTIHPRGSSFSDTRRILTWRI